MGMDELVEELLMIVLLVVVSAALLRFLLLSLLFVDLLLLVVCWCCIVDMAGCVALFGIVSVVLLAAATSGFIACFVSGSTMSSGFRSRFTGGAGGGGCAYGFTNCCVAYGLICEATTVVITPGC